MSLKERIIALICAILFIGLSMIILCTPVASRAINNNTVPTVEETTEYIPTYEETLYKALWNIQYIEPNTKEHAQQLKIEIDNYLIYLDNLRPSGDGNIEVYHNIIDPEKERVSKLKLTYQEIYNNYLIIEEQRRIEDIWAQKENRYPVATKIWLYLKNEMDLSDYVCAGILGNMMAESGGHTLNINWNNWDNATGQTYYGICQWYVNHDIANASLEAQLGYLNSSFTTTMTNPGHQWARDLYQVGFTYEQFKALTDSGEVAVAFAKIYERCASQYVELRRDLAQQAYNYFVLEGWE